MNGCPRGSVRKDTARETEPGLQAPWHFSLRGELACGGGDRAVGIDRLEIAPLAALEH